MYVHTYILSRNAAARAEAGAHDFDAPCHSCAHYWLAGVL